MERRPGRRRQPTDKGRPQSRSVDCNGGKTANQSYTREGPAVNKHTTEALSIKYVGLDVHKETIAVPVANSGTAGPRGLGIIPNDTDSLRALGKLGGPSELRVCADASDERIVELWLRDRPANTRVAYERDYARFRTFIGPRNLRTVGLGHLSDFAATLTGSPATRRRTLSAIKALLTTGFKMGALRFNVGAALRLPKVVSRRAERRLEEIEIFRLPTALDGQPRDRAIVEALYGTGARVEELVQLRRRQLVPDLEGTGGFATRYGKHGGRTIRVGRRTWEALQFLAEAKDPDERIIAITRECIRQILTAAAETAGLQKKISPHWLRHAHGSHAHQRGAPAASIRDPLGHASLTTTDVYLSSATTDRSSLYLQF